MSELKIVVLGDSIAAGLGVQDQCYADLLRLRLERPGRQVKMLNLAYTAFQITDSQKLLPKVAAENPDIVIIAHGITEAIIRPVPSAMRYVPNRWRPIGWLDPRPYYSRRLGKCLVQRVESALRWRLKVQLIQRCGGETLLPLVDFERQLSETGEWLLERTSARVVLMTHNGIDERFYPRSLAKLNEYRQCVHRSFQSDRIAVCDVFQRLTEWSDYFADHFHPNAAGHAKIAETLHQKVAL